MTMFDLNQDGSQEIIYRDRTNFTILDGPTGKTVYSYPMLSVTGTEYPVVVDINHDGSAEILIEGELHLLIQPMSSASNPPTSLGSRPQCMEPGRLPHHQCQ